MLILLINSTTLETINYERFSHGAVAQSVERPSNGQGLVQLYWHEFESQSRHEVGGKILTVHSVEHGNSRACLESIVKNGWCCPFLFKFINLSCAYSVLNPTWLSFYIILHKFSNHHSSSYVDIFRVLSRPFLQLFLFLTPFVFLFIPCSHFCPVKGLYSTIFILLALFLTLTIEHHLTQASVLFVSLLPLQ